MPQRFYRAAEIPTPKMAQAPSTLRLQVLPVTADGVFPLRLTGLGASGPVVFYASSNLVDWTSIFTNPPTTGPLDYWDSPTGHTSQRFYRAVENR